MLRDWATTRFWHFWDHHWGGQKRVSEPLYDRQMRNYTRTGDRAETICFISHPRRKPGWRYSADCNGGMLDRVSGTTRMDGKKVAKFLQKFLFIHESCYFLCALCKEFYDTSFDIVRMFLYRLCFEIEQGQGFDIFEITTEGAKRGSLSHYMTAKWEIIREQATVLRRSAL